MRYHYYKHKYYLAFMDDNKNISNDLKKMLKSSNTETKVNEYFKSLLQDKNSISDNNSEFSCVKPVKQCKNNGNKLHNHIVIFEIEKTVFHKRVNVI